VYIEGLKLVKLLQKFSFNPIDEKSAIMPTFKKKIHFGLMAKLDLLKLHMVKLSPTIIKNPFAEVCVSMQPSGL